MRTISDLSQEADQYFRQLKLDQKDTRQAYRYILSAIDTALATEDYSVLSALISYIENGNGQLAFQYIGRMQRILRILHVIMLEQKYHKSLFCHDCCNAEELWEKYMLTLFAFRRILFRLSESSTAEAVQYLQCRPVSHFAVYIIAQEELPATDQDFYGNLASIFAEYWSDSDLQQFFLLTNTSSAIP